MSENLCKLETKKALKYWQTPLGFKDWDISLRFRKMEDADGRNYWVPNKKKMAITIDPTTKHDAEFVLLHELVHIFLNINNTNMDALDYILEGLVDTVAKSFIRMRKNQGHKL